MIVLAILERRSGNGPLSVAKQWSTAIGAPHLHSLIPTALIRSRYGKLWCEIRFSTVDLLHEDRFACIDPVTFSYFDVHGAPVRKDEVNL